MSPYIYLLAVLWCGFEVGFQHPVRRQRGINSTIIVDRLLAGLGFTMILRHALS